MQIWHRFLLHLSATSVSANHNILIPTWKLSRSLGRFFFSSIRVHFKSHKRKDRFVLLDLILYSSDGIEMIWRNSTGICVKAVTFSSFQPSELCLEAPQANKQINTCIHLCSGKPCAHLHNSGDHVRSGRHECPVWTRHSLVQRVQRQFFACRFSSDRGLMILQAGRSVPVFRHAR